MSTTTLIAIAAVVILFYLYKKWTSGISPEEFRQKLNEEPGTIIDVRTPGEFNSGHLKRTDLNIDVSSNDFEKRLEKLNTNNTYYLYCRSGSRSARAAKIMERNGFQEVYNIGSFQRLVKAGFQRT